MSISDKTFVAERNISIFRKIDNLVKEPIAVGGNINNSIPIDEFEKLITKLSNLSRIDALHTCQNCTDVERLSWDNVRCATKSGFISKQ